MSPFKALRKAAELFILAKHCRSDTLCRLTHTERPILGLI